MRFIIPSLAAIAALSTIQGCKKSKKSKKEDNETKEEKPVVIKDINKEKPNNNNVSTSGAFRNSDDDFKDSATTLTDRRRQRDQVYSSLKNKLVKDGMMTTLKHVNSPQDSGPLTKKPKTSAELAKEVSDWQQTLLKLKNLPNPDQARARFQLLIRSVFFTLDAAPSCRHLHQTLEPEFFVNLRRVNDLLKDGKQSVLRFIQKAEDKSEPTEASTKLEELWEPLLDGSGSYLTKSAAWTADKTEIKLRHRNNQRVSVCKLLKDFDAASQSQFLGVMKTDYEAIVAASTTLMSLSNGL